MNRDSWQLFTDLDRARTRLREDFVGNWTLDALAEIAFLSPFHLQRTFKATFGETPHQFLTRRRLDEAKRLLIETDWSVDEVCLAVGFASVGTFSRWFVQRLGCSPGAFRSDARRCWALGRLWNWNYVPSCFARRHSQDRRGIQP